MSEKNVTILILFALFLIACIVEWIDENPYTFIWLLAVLGFVGYRVYLHRNNDDTGTTPPTDPPPSDYY